MICDTCNDPFSWLSVYRTKDGRRCIVDGDSVRSIPGETWWKAEWTPDIEYVGAMRCPMCWTKRLEYLQAESAKRELSGKGRR